MADARYRTGRKLGRTIYDGDLLIGMMDTPTLGAMVVRALNERDAMRSVLTRLFSGWKPALDQGTGEWFWERPGRNGEDMTRVEHAVVHSVQRDVDGR